MSFSELLAPIHQFLRCQTPDAWLDKAAQPEMLPVLLTDHLLCELNDNMCNVYFIPYVENHK